MAQTMNPHGIPSGTECGEAERIEWGSPRSRSVGFPREDNCRSSVLCNSHNFICIFICIPVLDIAAAKGPIRIPVSSPHSRVRHRNRIELLCMPRAFARFSMSVNGGGYRRASRKGAPRKFICEHPGCDKVYSRAEHLQRHQLNRKTPPPPLPCMRGQTPTALPMQRQTPTARLTRKPPKLVRQPQGDLSVRRGRLRSKVCPPGSAG